jgi:hypothetical protein
MYEQPQGSWSDRKGLARAILRDRGERRKWLGRITLAPLVMLGVGLWVLDGWIWASPWRVIFWWGGCMFATLAVILFALYDALAVFREERENARLNDDSP